MSSEGIFWIVMIVLVIGLVVVGIVGTIYTIRVNRSINLSVGKGKSIPGTATVIETRPTGRKHANVMDELVLVVEVQVPGWATYQAELKAQTPGLNNIPPQFQPGGTLRVRVDPKDHSHVVFDLTVGD